VRRWSEAATALLMTKPEIQSGVALRLPPHSKNRFWRYGPPIVWAALIFIGSSDLLSSSHTSGFIIRPLHLLFPNASEATLAAIHFALRKLGHFTEYAILAWLAARALRTSSRDWVRTRWFWLALAFVIGYALFDEFRQSFVPSRTASIFDSLIDTTGGLTALIVIFCRRKNVRDANS
jgi:VanZ family protein